MQEDFIISLKDVFIHQGNKLVLSGISFNLKPGDICYITGNIGEGKTSFLKLLYGELSLKQGEAYVLNMNLNKISFNKILLLRRNLGIVSQQQESGLFHDRNVYDNLKFILKNIGFQTKQIESRIDQVLNNVGMLDKKNKYIYELSEGEKQHIAIARAIINKPRLIIADEPTAHTDLETSKKILELLIKRAHKIGASLIIATHDMEAIKGLPGKILKVESKKMVPILSYPKNN